MITVRCSSEDCRWNSHGYCDYNDGTIDLDECEAFEKDSQIFLEELRKKELKKLKSWNMVMN